MIGTRSHCCKPSGNHHTYRQHVHGWLIPLAWFLFFGVLGACCVEPAHALPILDNDDGGTASISVQVSAPSLATLCATSVPFSATATSPTSAIMSYDWSASAAGPVSVLALNTFLLTLASSAAGKLTLRRVYSVACNSNAQQCVVRVPLVPDVDVPSSLLVAGAGYTFSVDVQDADGASGTASTTVTMSSLEPPVIVPLVPTALTVQRSNDTQLGISATVSDCLLGAVVSSALSVGWVQVAGPNVTLSVDSGNPSQVVILGGAFTAGAQYTFRVTVAVSSLPLLSSSLDFTIAEVMLAPLVAAIQPIAAEVSNTDPVTLDAGSSYVVVCCNCMAHI